MTWPKATVAVAVIVIVGFLLALILLRERHYRRVRFGLFVERDDPDDHLGRRTRQPAEPDRDEAPTEVTLPYDR